MQFALRAFLLLYHGMLALTGCFGLARRVLPAQGADVLLTGTFHSANWVLAHLVPLRRSRWCRRLRVVSVFDVPAIEGIEVIKPSSRLIALVGAVPARLLTFCWVALSARPDVVGGFHLLFNGLFAALVGRLIGARTAYFCVGGPAEVLGGGIKSENRLFERIPGPDEAIERLLVRAVRAFDLVVTMGTGAAQFFRERGIDGMIRVVSGGIDASRFQVREAVPEFDAILVGRLAPIKRIDRFLRAIHLLSIEFPCVRAAVVGDGILRGELEHAAAQLGIRQNVVFAGQQTNIEAWMQNAKIFTLTSESEGLSLAVMEAMMCGLPCVVSAVGDLPDLVVEGVNGFLVQNQDSATFAEKIGALLRDGALLERMSEEAIRAASKYELSAATRLWDELLPTLFETRNRGSFGARPMKRGGNSTRPKG